MKANVLRAKSHHTVDFVLGEIAGEGKQYAISLRPRLLRDAFFFFPLSDKNLLLLF